MRRFAPRPWQVALAGTVALIVAARFAAGEGAALPAHPAATAKWYGSYTAVGA